MLKYRLVLEGISAHRVHVFAEKEALRQEMEEDFKARMMESQQEVEEMKRSWQEKLAAAQGVRLAF